jgi:hypothetical protein
VELHRSNTDHIYSIRPVCATVIHSAKDDVKELLLTLKVCVRENLRFPLPFTTLPDTQLPCPTQDYVRNCMNTDRRKGKADRELEAIGTILRTLDGLDGESIQRVFDYVLGRMSLARPTVLAAAPVSLPSVATAAPHEMSQTTRKLSIRDLKETKRPESSNQMAALVAYYLSEIADPSESKDAITAADIEKYFKQAGFKLPKSIPQALPNASTAGYFDGVGRGQYRLNPVGYNLVVHGLPPSESEASSFRKKRRKTTTRK